MEEYELIAAELMRSIRLLRAEVDALRGESLRVELAAPERSCSVALSRIHQNGEYFIHTAVMEKQGGTAGEITFSGRNRNGFTVSYDGTAERIVLDLWIQDRPEGTDR